MITVSNVELPLANDPARVLVLFGPLDSSVCNLESEGVIVESGPELPAWKQLLNDTRHWDVIIVGSRVQRFYDTSTTDDQEMFARWLTEHSELAILPARKILLDANRTDIGPWEAPEALAISGYVTELPSVTGADFPPLVVVSRQWLWAGHRWLDGRALAPVGSQKTLPAGAGGQVRTFLGTNGELVKVELCRPDFFDDAEIIREVDVLESPWARAIPNLSLPQVIDHHRGHTVSVLVREAIDGVVLTEFLSTHPQAAAEVATQTLALAKKMASGGVFHNDFRPWNLLWNNGEVKAVDFSRMSPNEDDARSLPNIVALAGTLGWILQVDSDSRHIRLFEDFDGDIVAALTPHWGRHGTRLFDLYDKPWRNLGTTTNSWAITRGMSLEDLMAQLVPPPIDAATT